MKTIGILLATVLLMLTGGSGNASAQTVTETVLHSFAGSPTDGGYPEGGLVQGSDGNFYGTTYHGGTNSSNDGTVFRISPSGSCTILYSFDYCCDGIFPTAGLVQGSDSNFYGTTELGGTNTEDDGGGGTVFRISPSGNFTSLYTFGNYTGDGVVPVAGLVQGSDGNFYGTTSEGGTSTNCEYGCGTVFRISPGGTETILYSFTGSPDGQSPQAGLVQGSDGNFYGTTETGGTSTNPACGTGCGTVFRISPGGSYTSLYSFVGPPTDGENPLAGLVQGSDSNFYGTTQQGGTNVFCSTCGTVFRISPSGTETTLYSFFGYGAGDGDNPWAGLVQASDGNFYGTTHAGGTLGEGNVFRISPSGDYTNLYSFGSPPADGEYPIAGLVLGSDSNFYGTTEYGGTNGDNGTVFRLDVGLGPVSTNCTYSINPTNAVFGAAGGPGSVSVSASNGCAWTAVSNDGWITITSGTNGTGNGTVNYTVAANTSTNDLTGTISIADQTFTVTQAGIVCNFFLDSASASFVGAGGSSNVAVTANGTNCAWIASTTNSWIAITFGSSGSGDGTVDYTVAANISPTGRSGTMTIAGQTYAVFEGGTTPCTYTLSATNTSVAAGGGSGSVNVTAGIGCAWTAASSNSFITITSGRSGSGDGTVDYSVAANTNTVSQTGSMTIAGQTFTVTEAGTVTAEAETNCTYSLGSTSANFGAAGGSGDVGLTVSSNGCAWTASTTNSWITISSGSSGSGTGTVSYTATANASASEQIGTITIAGQTYTVTEVGATPVTYSFSTPVQTLKTKLVKKTGVTTTNSTITVNLVVANTGTTESPKSSVLLWLGQGSAFSPSGGAAPLAKNVKALKEDASVTIKIKSKKLTGDQAGTFIFATDADDNILASVEVPAP